MRRHYRSVTDVSHRVNARARPPGAENTPGSTPLPLGAAATNFPPREGRRVGSRAQSAVACSSQLREAVCEAVERDVTRERNTPDVALQWYDGIEWHTEFVQFGRRLWQQDLRASLDHIA